MSNLALRQLLEEELFGAQPPAKADVTVTALRDACVADMRIKLPPREHTHQADNLRLAMREAVELYGNERAASFTPDALKVCRRLMEKRGISRRVINQRVQQIRYVFGWGVEHHYVTAEVFGALRGVKKLEVFRTKAPERPRVKPVPLEHVQSTLPELSMKLADMVQLQLLTGMRPGDIVRLRRDELDTSGPTWVLQPVKHKMAYKGKVRRIDFGPKGGDILVRHFRGEGQTFLFLTPRGTPYRVLSYANAIRRAAKRAGVPHWSPNQLRHLKGTQLRQTAGLETAQAVLGHERIETTQIYAERSEQLAMQAALRFG